MGGGVRGGISKYIFLQMGVYCAPGTRTLKYTFIFKGKLVSVNHRDVLYSWNNTLACQHEPQGCSVQLEQHTSLSA